MAEFKQLALRYVLGHDQTELASVAKKAADGKCFSRVSRPTSWRAFDCLDWPSLFHLGLHVGRQPPSWPSSEPGHED